MGERKKLFSQPVSQSQSKKNISCCPPPVTHTASSKENSSPRRNGDINVSRFPTVRFPDTGRGQVNQVGCC